MAVAAHPKSTAKLAHCPIDDWDFDPRYTDGVCPICGWKPPGVVASKPEWMVLSERVPWDLVGIVILAVVLIILGVLVARAAGANNLGLF